MTNYTWKVYYSDGTTFSQFNEDGSENLFGSIDESKIVNFVLSNKHEDTIQLDDFVLSLPSGFFVLRGLPINFGEFASNRLIYFRKHSAEMNADGTVQTVRHVLGIQATVNEQNRKIMFIIDDDTKEIGLLYD